MLLEYRKPYRYDRLLGFLEFRAIKGVESVSDGIYKRTVRITQGCDASDSEGSDGNGGSQNAGKIEAFGWVSVSDRPEESAIELSVSESLRSYLPLIAAKTRRLFDTDCDPDDIDKRLADFHERTGGAYRCPGVRVPCSFDGFEMSVRAILGQQITVKAANTLAGRLADAFGTPLADVGMETPYPELSSIFPSPRVFLAEDAAARMGELGIIGQRARSICVLARMIDKGDLELRPGADVSAASAALLSIPGIGPWTAQYILMRALAYSDAFPAADYGIKHAFEGLKPKEIEALSQAWRPVRSYAVMSIWSRPAPAPASNPAPADPPASAPTSASAQSPAACTAIYLDTYESPVGALSLASDGEHLCGLWLEGQKYFQEKLEQRLGVAHGRFDRVSGKETCSQVPVLLEARAWLDTYFEGRDPGALPPIAFHGTPFQEEVWAELERIPYGHLTTYGAIAQALSAKHGGKHQSARAVGVAVGRNPISIIVPCHRVVGASGSLTGYAGGIDRKLKLLKTEGVDTDKLKVPKKGTAL